MIYDLPYLATLPSGKGALKEHRHKNSALYERVFTRQDHVIRYYSDLPAVCVGQYIADNQYKADEDFLFLHVLENQLIYALYVKEHLVQRELIGQHAIILESFGYELHQGIQIVLTTDTMPLAYEPVTPPKVVQISMADIPQEYHLVSRGTFKPVHISIAALLGIGVLASVIFYMQTPQEVHQQQVDPWQQWSQDFVTQAPADSALHQAVIALTYNDLLPPDWTSDGVMVAGNNIIMPLKPLTDGAARFESLKAFADLYPELHLTLETKQLIFPIIPREKPVLVNLGQYPHQLYDALLILGATNVHLTNTTPIGPVSRIQISATFTDISPTLLAAVADSVQYEPVFLQQISVSNASGNHINCTFDLIVEGIDAVL